MATRNDAASDPSPTAGAPSSDLAQALWAPVSVAELEDASSALAHEGHELEHDDPVTADAILRAADFIDQAVDALNDVGHA